MSFGGSFLFADPRALTHDIASQVFPLGFSALNSLRLFPRHRLAPPPSSISLLPSTARTHHPHFLPSDSSNPLFRLPSVFPRRQAKNSPTLGQLTLIFHPRHPSRPPHPLFLCLLSTLGAHTVTRSHAANTCSCLPLQSYGSGDDATHSATFNHKYLCRRTYVPQSKKLERDEGGGTRVFFIARATSMTYDL